MDKKYAVEMTINTHSGIDDVEYGLDQVVRWLCSNGHITQMTIEEVIDEPTTEQEAV